MVRVPMMIMMMMMTMITVTIEKPRMPCKEKEAKPGLGGWYGRSGRRIACDACGIAPPTRPHAFAEKSAALNDLIAGVIGTYW